MEIKSKIIKIEPIEKLVSDPKNENIHSDRQIEALQKIIKVNGFREPLTISNRSGYVVCGHGRLLAAKNLGMTELPVIYQDFENEADEMRHRMADNEIARYATLDREKFLDNLGDLEIDNVDFEEFGLLDFSPLQDISESIDNDNQDEKKFSIQIDFPTKDEMESTMDKFSSSGYMVKIL